MALWPLILLAFSAQPPQVELSTLSGSQVSGELRQLTSEGVTVQTSTEEVHTAIEALLELRFVAGPAGRLTTDPIGVTLVDGSQVECTGFASSGKTANIEITGAGPVEISPRSLASVRFGSTEGAAGATWNDLLQRTLKQDMLVVRKGNILDHYQGVIGDVDEQRVKFLLDGDEVSVRRERVFGLIYFRRVRSQAKPICRVELGEDNFFNVTSINLQDENLTANLAVGGQVVIPVASVRVLDFSQGKVVYLSQIQPRRVQYVPFFDITWKYRRDHNLDGGPIRLGGKTFARGLSIHSRTLLRYRLSGKFRRFQAVMGIDDVVNRLGDVHVVIKADEAVLLETDVLGTDQPRRLDLDVTGVRDLEILVDFGSDLDIADHLDLADAKVIK